MNRVITLTEHILQEEHKAKNATGNLTLLLNQVAEAGKNIASHVKRSGLADIIGVTGNTNAFDEEVQKLDEYSNMILIDMLTNTHQVRTIGSEELATPLVVNPHGSYDIYFDPLDGSSNIDVNVSIGTIFSIFHATGDTLQAGSKQVAAGYLVYGSSVMFVYTTGHSVDGFTLDPAIGSFLLSHPNIQTPHLHAEYSINEGNVELFDEDTKQYLTHVKKDLYKLRYIGSLVADFHRILLRGGIFLYPADTKHPKGKLRLMHELNALALLIETAGGKALSQAGRSPLQIQPSDVHERAAFITGSAGEVEKYSQIVKNK